MTTRTHITFDGCGCSVVRNSREHDEAICDENGENWFCGNCYDGRYDEEEEDEECYNEEESENENDEYEDIEVRIVVINEKKYLVDEKTDNVYDLHTHKHIGFFNKDNRTVKLL